MDFTPLALGFLLLVGAFIFRMRGGMPPSFPRPVDQVLFAIPFGLKSFFELAEIWRANPALEIVILAAAFAATVAALCKGHGNAMDLGGPDAKPEWYEDAIIWANPHLSPYWYDVLSLAVSGMTYTLPVAIATMNPLLLLVGALKAPAYAIAKRADAGTEGGELLTGAVLWIALVR